jgi:hypothetical protein
MDTKQSLRSGECGPRSELAGLYEAVPRWRGILAAVEDGRIEFENVLREEGLLDEFGASTSSVHDYRGVEVHAFILGIVSAGCWSEVRTKSFLTYASHWIDDFFDSPQRVTDPDRLLRDRHDIRRALANMGRVGQVGFVMANRARHPAAVYKALHRMFYGGLVQRATDYAERHGLVQEYLGVAAQFVAPWLVAEIRRLQPEAHWTTNKTVLELLGAAEEDLDFTTSELWNLVYGPALYYEDVEEERARGELSFEEKEAPTLVEMLKMIRLGATHLAPMFGPGSPQLRQLEFAARALPNLPDEIVREYRLFWDRRLVGSRESVTQHV